MRDYANYCGYNLLSDDYHKCPLYKDATGKQNDGGCYLTSACMSQMGVEFDDNCYELSVLREFRDSYVKENYPNDIRTYYEIAPQIVVSIRNSKNSKEAFNKIYNELIVPCCKLIEENKLYEAYCTYKKYSLNLREIYLG